MREWKISGGALPCPKCGSTALSAWTDQCCEDSVDGWVECRKCGHTGNRIEHTWGGQEAAEWAVHEWNDAARSAQRTAAPTGTSSTDAGSTSTRGSADAN